MQYSLRALTIHDLYNLVDKNQIDLNPSYQRNFIWSLDNQNELIDTILKGYPLPNFFLYKKTDGTYEMVDGQQRTKTIYLFVKGSITSSREFQKVSFDQVDKEKFFNYEIPVVVIENLTGKDSLKEFYVLINKKGVHLNIAEVNKSEYLDTNFLQLANELLAYQNLINLNLFTEATVKRMNDRSFVEELLAFLYSGFKDKKKTVESLFKSDIDEAEYYMLENEFKSVIDRINDLNKIKLITLTRYKQKNDFYTLFSFIHENIHEEYLLLSYQYQILLLLDGKDEEGRQFIRPSNEECQSLKEYANNCVTQSNSKKARENRLLFFNSMLKNKSSEMNEIMADVLNYLSEVLGEEKIKIKEIGGYHLIDINKL